MFNTTYKYFKFRTSETITIEAVKRQYRKLALENHPDRGGDVAVMAAINAEFDTLRKRYYNVHESVDGGTYTDERQTTVDDITANFEDLITELLKMDGVEIEICGKFVWLAGDTYPHKDAIKGLGFRWARSKKRWYLAPADWKPRRHMTMKQIRSAFGSHVVEREDASPALLTA